MNSLSRHMTNRALSSSLVSTRLQSSLAGGAAATSSSTIQLPIYKERKPTDVLRALEGTIKRDPTAPHYKYIDDPYLIPVSQSTKRSYALAKESGRKAAMWIRQELSYLFDHRVMDPVIESFLPKIEYTSKDQVSEEVLKKVIKDANPSDALTIYKLLEEQVSVETKSELLQLLCYYNNEEPLSEEFMEHKWFKNDSKTPSWKHCSETDKLFAFLKDQGGKIAADAYSAMICGNAKYINTERAWQLSEEADRLNIPLTIEAYNYIISLATTITDNGSERRKIVLNTMGKIKEQGLEPNIGTLNSALKVTSRMNRNNAEEFCRLLFGEFKSIGIEPSLASYYYALKAFYRKDSPACSLLREIMNKIKNKSFVAQSKADTLFFPFAMDVAANIVIDPELGDQIHKLLLTGDNYNFIGNNFGENIYYRHYFMLQVQNRPIDAFMNNYYDVIVPNIYVPEPMVMNAILSTLEFSDPDISREYLARIWSHMVQFEHLERKNLVSKALNLMRVHCKPDNNSPFNAIFADAAWTVWKYVLLQQERRIQTLNWEGRILGDMAILCLRADEVDNSATIVTYLLEKQSSIIGVPDFEQLDILLDGFIMKCFAPPTIDLVTYCAENDFPEVPGMVEKIESNLSLTEWQHNRLKSFVDAKKGSKKKSKDIN
ncbi:GSCOCG00000346001-RA-CDS [Cotesia congregata]|uniref:Small ribosomal subunit protein mS39 n=1 Tax=Cotesia congregata TaxID=51543 RepID=A0A8J2MJT0_COTCN|nr:GSCOCG00000346001-RA-CDS [Cotesia congregata]CAG5088259.1 Similar to CG4679: Protein PTCD3 homolog [Cotesia congregata]